MRVCPYKGCGCVAFGTQTYCSEEHKRAAWRQAHPEARDHEKEVKRLRYAAANQPRLWPCKQCGGLMLNTRRPTNVCRNCNADSPWVPVKIAPRPINDPLRPALVYFGTMNVPTRYVDAGTVMLVCGYPEAIPTLEALVDQLDGVSVIEPSPDAGGLGVRRGTDRHRRRAEGSVSPASHRDGYLRGRPSLRGRATFTVSGRPCTSWP
jgi:hypothetical protein